MNKTTFYKSLITSLFLFFLFFANLAIAQVGIGTTTPDATAVLDVSSTTQGMLTPRMTTTQRNAIASPANGLMVYDTTLKSFYYYDLTATSWISMVSTSDSRLKFKRIKSTDVLATVLAAEKTAGGGAKYLLDTNTLYEINGTINVDLPIDLNNAYIAGLDTNEDKLVMASGTLFSGSGGSIKSVTLQATAGAIFALTGTAADSFVFRDAIVVSSANIGTISGFGLVFCSIVQYAGNGNGITFNNISKLLLSNIGWFGNNSGTYEKLTGTFGLVQKQGGFTEVTGTSIGFDVSSNATITNDAVMSQVVFTGTLTSGKYVNGYTTGSYTGFNFNNKWAVNCPGIPREEDASAVGDFYYDYAVGNGVGSLLNSNPSKLSGVSLSDNLYRFSRGGVDNRITYLGNKKRFFRATGTVSFQADANGITYIFYIAKNGVVINKSKVYIKANSTSDLLAIPLNTLTEMSPNDYLEVFAERFSSGSGSVTIASLNLFVF